MASNMTPKEQQFFTNLQQSFAPKQGETRTPEQQALTDALLAAIQARLEQDGEAKVTDIIDTMQDVANGRIQALKDLKTQNDHDLADAKVKLAKSKDPLKTIDLPGQKEMEAIQNSLTTVLSQDRLSDVAKLAHDADLEFGTNEPYGIDMDYETSIVTQAAQTSTWTGKQGHSISKEFAQQGKLTKPFRYASGVKGAYNLFVVREDLIKNNGARDYDTADGYMASYLKNNPTVRELPAIVVTDPKDPKKSITFDAVELKPRTRDNWEYNLNQSVLWFQHANHKTPIDWKKCEVIEHKDNLPLMPGEQVVLPGGNAITPAQYSYHCASCDIKLSDVPAPIRLHAALEVASTPTPPPTRLVMLEPPVNPVEFARQNTSSSNPKEWKQGSLDHALEALARSGLDPQFTYQHYIITDIATRDPVVLSRESGEGPGAHKLEGKHLIGDNDKTDDNNKRRNPSGRTDVEDVLFGDRGHVHFPGEIAAIRNKLEVAWLQQNNLSEKDLDGKSTKEKKDIGEHMIADIKAGKVQLPADTDEIGNASLDAEDGKMVREDKLVGASAYGGKKYATKLLGITIPIGGFFGRPVGYSIQRPDHQVNLNANAERWGVASADVALSDLGRHGFNVMFRDEETQDTAPLTSPDRVYAYMNLLNSKKNFVESMQKMETATSADDKQKAAETALVAWRDMRTNMLVRRVDAMNKPLDESQKGLESYISQSIGPNKLDAIKDSLYDLDAHPHLQVVDMPEDQLHAQRDWSKNSSRFENIHPGQTSPAYNASQATLSTWRSQNEFELGMARATERDPDEKTVVSKTEAAIDAMNHRADGSLNLESIKAQSHFIATNRNMQIAALDGLSDMWKNPQNYFTPQELHDGADKKLFNRLMPEVKGDAKTPDQKNDKDARRDETRAGNTSPFLFAPDGYFANAKPEVGGPVLAKGIDKDPAAWEEYSRRMSSKDYGVDSKGHTDGRRYGVMYLRALGSQMVALQQYPDGSVRDGITPEGYGRIISTVDDDAKGIIHDAVQKTVIYGEAGALNMSVYGREKTDNVLAEAQRKGTSVGDTFKNVTAEVEMRQHQVLGMIDQPLKFRDFMYLAISKHPEAFKGLEKAVSARGDVAFAGFEDMLNDVAKAQKKHPNDPQVAMKIYGEYFTRMENKGDKRKGARMEHAINDAITAIAHTPVMTDAMVDAATTSGPTIQAAWLSAIPATNYADNGRETDFDRNTAKGRQIVGARDDHSYGDKPYASLLFTLPTDEKTGKVDLHKGLFGLGIRDIEISHEQAANYNMAMTGKPFGAMVSTGGKKDRLALDGVTVDANGQLLDQKHKTLTGAALDQANAQLAEIDRQTKAKDAALSLNLNLGEMTEGNAKLTNPVLILTPEEGKKLTEAKQLDKSQKGATDNQLDAKAQIVIDRALQNGTIPPLNGQDLTAEQLTASVKGLLKANMVTLVRPEDLVSGKAAGGFNLGRTGDIDTTTSDDQNHVGGVDKKWALAFLLLFKSTSTTTTYIIHHECAGCQPVPLPTPPSTQLPGIGIGH